MPPAISGQGGHDATFAVAKALVHNFALPNHEAWPILLEFNSRCQPPWSQSELQHKISSASNLTRPCKPKGHLLDTEEAWRTQERFPFAPKSESSYWNVRIEPLPGKKSLIEPQIEKAVIEELTGHATVEALEKPSPANPEDIEVSRIAGELRKLNEAGALKQPEDPQFFASVIRAFGATFLPLKAPRNGGLPENRWSADVLTGYSQPRTPEEYKAFLMAAFEPEDVFDFSNPSDVAEFERLYRRPCRKGPRACE
jgi:hypothetical protein